MAISTEDVLGGITKIIIDGRLDIDGAAALEKQMDAIPASRLAILVDMQNVSYVGSMGLRSLVAPAHAIRKRGGKMVLLGPNEFVGKVLKASGVDTLIPVHQELQSALAALQ
jgi:anti-sigma B factor antagonist